MADCRAVYVEDGVIVATIDDHRRWVVIEQQPERRFALLQFGDVDAQADYTTVAGATFVDQDATAIRQILFVSSARMVKFI